MRRSRRVLALAVAVALVCAASMLCGAPLGAAAPAVWGSRRGAPDWAALAAQLRAHARKHCRPRAHAGRRPGRCSRKARHGASSTNPTAAPAPQAGAGAPGSSPAEGLSPALPGVPAVGGSGPAGGSEGSGGAGTVEGAAPPSIPHVQVVAVEYHYTLSRTTVPAGKIVLQFVNSGQDEHNLNVLSGEGELEAAFAKTVSHGVRETSVNLRQGSFTLFCSLPEHEAKGMHATLTVQ